ncbi:MAG: hypothetical protein PHF25_06885 [Candidatus Margulisbacteria bacterium]|nr:hypothetical protein [Candidatus Margulisiibacteriota bacterium]
MTADGNKAIVVWGWQAPGSTSAYLMAWTSTPGNDPISSTLLDAKYMEADISKDGNYISFVTTANLVGYRDIGGETENIIGQGSNISWTDDNKIGFVDFIGGYSLYDTNNQTLKNYSIEAGYFLQCAVINGAGTKIAFRTFGGPNTGIAVGILNN